MADPNKWYPASGENGVVGKFEYYPILDVKASREADEEITMDIIVCRMKAAGSVDESYVKVKPDNQQELVKRFPDAWLAFQGQDVKIDGSPISVLGFPEQVNVVMQLHGVLSVEQLAELTDIACQNIGFGTRKRRETAVEYLKHGADALEHNKIANKSDPVPGKRGPGRPKKNADQVAA